jgi:hypothetical protein
VRRKYALSLIPLNVSYIRVLIGSNLEYLLDLVTKIISTNLTS